MPAQNIWLVEYLPEAVQEFHGLEAKEERVGVLNVVDKLVALGPSCGRRT